MDHASVAGTGGCTSSLTGFASFSPAFGDSFEGDILRLEKGLDFGEGVVFPGTDFFGETGDDLEGVIFLVAMGDALVA